MSFSCTKCQSENTQKLSIVSKSGTTNIHMSSAGAGIGHDGTLGVIKTKGKSQSELAKAYGPPMEKPYLAPSIAVLVLGLFSCIFFGEASMWIAALIVVVYCISAFKYNTKEYPALFSDWDEHFLCLRCENIFIPQQKTKLNC